MTWSASRCHGIVIAVLVLVAAVDSARAQGDVVARFGDDAIVRGEVDSLTRRLGLSDAADEAQRQQAFAAVLEQIIDERALRGELLQAGMGVEPEVVATVIDRLRQQVTAQGKSFDDFLKESNRTLDSLREQVALELAVEAYVRPRLTPDAINRVFEQHRRELDGTRLRVSHVLLRPDGGGGEEIVEQLMKRAEVIRREIVQGRVSFAEAAAMHSAGPSRREGGDLGWINRESPMIDAFAAEVFTLAKGGVSEPFLTLYGVHIATVTAVEPGRAGPTAVRSRLEKMLAAEIVRGLVAQGRRRTPVTFSPGVPHFDPDTLGQPAARRPVVVRGQDQ